MTMFDKAIPRRNFEKKICSKCQLKCVTCDFCYHLQHILEDKFEAIFKTINRNFLRITSSGVNEAMVIICASCPMKNECFIEKYDFDCTRKLRIQLTAANFYEDDYIFGFKCGSNYGNNYVNNNNNNNNYSNNYYDPAVFITDDDMVNMFNGG